MSGRRESNADDLAAGLNELRHDAEDLAYQATKTAALIATRLDDIDDFKAAIERAEDTLYDEYH